MNDLNLFNRIAASRDAATVWDLAVEKFSAMGFSRANYGLTRFRSERHYGDPDDALYLSSAGPEFEKHYFRNNFFSRTPLFRWAVQNEGACTWAWVREAYLAGRLTPDEAETVRINLAIGVTAGITISFPETSARAKGALGLIADPGLGHAEVEAIFSNRGDELQAVAHIMHLKLMQLPMPRRRALTARQREALEWVADGKTTQDVALIMEVSPAMIEKHLRLAREALSVDTTAQAVAKAAMLNLIFQRAEVAQVGNPRLS
ncbi:MAG: autoinducer binding domain-containing protein [Paracoccaceae bacterium]